jgi:hypothetical protein
MSEQQQLFPRHRDKLASWSFTGDFGRNFERLIDLQMWCFGCDIRNTSGNILTEFGFCQTRPPAGTHGSTHYWMACDSMYTLHLWGFGMIITDNTGALCLKRFERAPKIVEKRFDSAPIFKPHDLPSFHQPRTKTEREIAQRLLNRLCRELFGYETYLIQRGLSSYRKGCIATSPKNARVRGLQEPRDAWTLLQSDNS